MFLLILCIFLIRKISKKLTIYIKSIRILKDIRKNTDDNIVQGDCLLLFKSLLNEYFGNILLWMILVETSYKRIGTMQIHHKFMLLPYQISFFQRILKGLFHLRVQNLFNETLSVIIIRFIYLRYKVLHVIWSQYEIIALALTIQNFKRLEKIILFIRTSKIIIYIEWYHI